MTARYTPGERDDGLPAFPLYCGPGDLHNNEGMSLRDYFAAQFMARAQSLCEDRDGGWSAVNAAACAYEMADAMLEARKP